VIARIDLNCDLGEGAPADEAVMPLVSSANVACGVHAGDDATMRRTIVLARRHGVAIGAHPGLADRAGFGRREVAVAPEGAYRLVLEQVGALAAIAGEAGVALAHVKPHGALYNLAARDAALADALAAAVRACDDGLALFGQPGTEHERAAGAAGLRFVAEAFADRGYRADGTLVPRAEPGAMIEDPEVAAARIVALLRDGGLRARDGAWVPLVPGTVCVHGDSPRAVATTTAVRRALLAAGVAIVAPGAAP